MLEKVDLQKTVDKETYRQVSDCLLYTSDAADE